MKIENIKDIKARKKFGATTEEFFKGSSDFFDGCENIVVTGIKDGRVYTYYYQSNTTSVIGLLELAKSQIIEDL
ncbi:hypothetical protein [Lactococcus formosensis]|uniref:hypothetical protein n=1 Tax=Lactococcus formosensis TaxID=1281486 RepID=UPI0032659295